MDLLRMLQMQSKLDERIIEDKLLKNFDLVPNTVLSLQVELAEMANEGRWFKHWSNDQKPREKTVLEEFADAVHFFLSLSIQKGWQEVLFIFEDHLDEDEFDGDLTAWYLEMIYFLNKAYMEKYPEEENMEFKSKTGFTKNQYWFRTAWTLFLNIGINGFGFTLEKIEQAYFDKNAVNHQRQEHGY